MVPLVWLGDSHVGNGASRILLEKFHDILGNLSRSHRRVAIDSLGTVIT